MRNPDKKVYKLFLDLIEDKKQKRAARINHLSCGKDVEAVFKCSFLDIGGEILQFNNASIYVQFGVDFIKFFDILFFKKTSHLGCFP